jgi:hypothetical protein
MLLTGLAGGVTVGDFPMMDPGAEEFVYLLEGPTNGVVKSKDYFMDKLGTL